MFDRKDLLELLMPPVNDGKDLLHSMRCLTYGKLQARYNEHRESSVGALRRHNEASRKPWFPLKILRNFDAMRVRKS